VARPCIPVELEARIVALLPSLSDKGVARELDGAVSYETVRKYRKKYAPVSAAPAASPGQMSLAVAGAATGARPKSADIVASLEWMLNSTLEQAQLAARDGKIQVFGALARQLPPLTKLLHALRPKPPPTAEDLELQAGPKASAVAEKLRRRVRRLKRADLETGKCGRCGAPLPAATAEAWRAEIAAALDRGDD